MKTKWILLLILTFMSLMTYTQDIRLITEEANKDNAQEQYNIAYCYYHGKGVDKDELQAVYWYRKAAVQGNEEARKNLKNLRKRNN